MKNFKIVLAYDGKRYKGFRKLSGKSDRTIQGKLENILSKLYEEPVEVISAVNTDAAVHAKHQVVSFKSPSDDHKADKLHNYMETFLPDDIIIISVDEVDERFHARYNVTSITYEYHLWKSNAKQRPLFERDYVKLMDKTLNVIVMEEAANRMIGEQDYRAFTSNSKVRNPVKNVKDVKVTERENDIIISITSNGYLLNMERIMVGTLIQVGLYERDVESVDKAFSTRETSYAGHKAMAGALCLVDVSYD
jgi:tRNA pseudouridine38-40 synthase